MALSLAQMVDEVLAALAQHGYSAETIKRYTTTYRGLMAYANQYGITEYTEAVGGNYLNERYGVKPKDWLGEGLPPRTTETWYRLVVLAHYQRTGSVVGAVRRLKGAFVCPEPFTDAYQAFEAFCTRKQYIVLGKQALVKPVQTWLRFLEDQQISDLNQTDAALLTAFLSRYSGHSPYYLATIVSSIRGFFKALAEAEVITGHPWTMLPQLHYPRQAFIPASWTPADVQRLLDAMDQGSPIGKRDYALLLVVVRLGLRASDVRNLTLAQLDWSGKRLTLIQTKTKRPLELPLLEDVGWALIDYLKHGRPHTAAQQIFVNHRAPYGRFNDTNALQRRLHKYMQFAGLEIPRDEHRGLHSLRSTLARTLWEQGTPLPVISDVWGHENAQSARSYLRINLDALRRCPVDPEAVFVDER